MEIKKDDYLISDNKALLNYDSIYQFLAKSYWANQRSKETIDLSIKNSICYGLYYQQKQIGFARAVTDHATIYWLADVFIDEEYRGKGIGKWFVEGIIESPELCKLTGILGTMDAHKLYERFGFKSEEDRLMRRRP